ncbi:MAG: class I SAM-dependent methyltransferase [Bacteroidetes bacterium]|nr:class I SAM-dependent methyltransferase [Bacteroidota bacterium]
MAENKSGIHSIISAPWIYNLVQFVAGARMYREKMVSDYIKPFDGCKILDIGCGTGEYVHYFREHCTGFEYYGFDGEGVYIDYANDLFKDDPNVHFYKKILTADEVKEFNNFDIVIATGVMHHLDDDVVESMLTTAKLALKPGGRLITYDPGNYDDSNWIERFFVKYDRGRSIRYERDYARLIGKVFTTYRSWTPYLTWFTVRNVIFECTNN